MVFVTAICSRTEASSKQPRRTVGMQHATLLLLLLCWMAVDVASASAPYRKQLNGPPDEFELHRLPRPTMAVQEEQSAFIRFVLKPGFNRRELWVDGDRFAFSFLSPVSNVVKLRLWNPNEERVSLKPAHQDAYFPLGGVELKHDAYSFDNPIHGRWILEMYMMQGNTMEEAAVIVWNDSPLRIYSHLDSYNLHVHKQIGVVARLAQMNYEKRSHVEMLGASAIEVDNSSIIFDAHLEVVLPDGTEQGIKMYDDGAHGDLLANDGVFGGHTEASEEGVYKLEAMVTGRTPDGRMFQRSTQHVIAVVEDQLELTGYGAVVPLHRNNVHARTRVLLGVESQSNGGNDVGRKRKPLRVVNTNKKHGNQQEQQQINSAPLQGSLSSSSRVVRPFRAYAEVWATDSNGKMQPACWIGGIVDAQAVEAACASAAGGSADALQRCLEVSENLDSVLALELDLRWLKRAHLHEPVELRNAFVVDARTNIPLSDVDAIEIESDGSATVMMHTHLGHIHAGSEITTEMRNGYVPDEVRERLLQKRRAKNNNNNNNEAGNLDGNDSEATTNSADTSDESEQAPNLLLVHGYCSDTNPWEDAHNAAPAFTNALFFLDQMQSRSNDEFANMIFEFAEDNDMSHFGIIGHSQGGLASTHLKNYYYSGLDEAEGDRVIQSLGSPYRGCRLAGTAAMLGKMFGVGCGHNFDLSVDGAALWGSGITTETRSKLYYYTSTASKGKYCNFASNLVLSRPNDGVTEIDLASFDGAYYMGNGNNECHTINMNFYAQYYNKARNQEMNAAAAR